MVSFTEKNRPAEINEIDLICKKLGISKENWLRVFWSECNGAILEDRIVIYSTGQIFERNTTYEIEKNFPEYVSVGDDSGGGLILIPKKGLRKFYFLDSGDPFIEDAEVFDSVEELTMSVVGVDGGLGDVVAVAHLKPSASDVLRIKKDFELDCSIAALAKKLECKNEVILKNVHCVKYEAALDTHGKFVRFISIA